MQENPTSEYRKIRQYVHGLIFKSNGQSVQIPTILELAEKFGVCRQTVSKAMKELTAEGYVIGRKGVGTFTNPAKFMEYQSGERFPVIGIFFRDGHGTHLSTYDAHVAAALLKRISLLPAIVQLATAEGTSPEEIKSAVESRNFDAVIWEQPDEKRLEALRLLTAETGNYGPWLRQVRGFRRAYEEAGIPLNDKLFLKHQNLDALRNIIELGVPVDAVFNHPNLIRNEIFHLMQEMHIDVENECRLICNSLAASVNPEFRGYVYQIDFDQVAEAAVRMLQSAMQKKKMKETHQWVDFKVIKQL